MTDQGLNPQRHPISAPDGRSLRAFDYGSDNGLAVVSHHGTPPAAMPTHRWFARHSSAACG